MHKIICVCGVAGFFLGGLTGCVTKELGRRLGEREEEIRHQTTELAWANRSSGEKPLSWKEAVKMLEERNLSLQKARLQVERAKREKSRQWRTWLPKLAVYASLQSSLAQLGNLSSSDLRSSVIAPLNIPNPFTERASAFQLALSVLQAEDSYTLSYRRQIATLYRIFSRYEQLLADQRKLQQAQATSPTDALRELETRGAHQEMVRSLQDQLAQVLNLPGEKPVPIPESRPVLDYDERIDQLIPGKNYGQLACRLYAYQIEAALLSEKGIKFNRWPSLSLGSSSPSVYDSSSGYQDPLDAGNIYLYSGLSKSYDLTGRETESIVTAEQNTEFVKKTLRQSLDRESREWITLKKRYHQLLLNERLASERIQSVREVKSGGSALTELKALRSGGMGMRPLARSKEQLVMELWIWDEEKWK
ncbi:MAG: hypothetical protein QM680_06135 [Luteolibacter sp.]